MMRLRSIDAEQTDRVVRVAARDDDGVAVEHVHHAVLRVGHAPLLTEPPPHRRRDDEHRDQRGRVHGRRSLRAHADRDERARAVSRS
jgi:hypothetical protein